MTLEEFTNFVKTNFPLHQECYFTYDINKNFIIEFNSKRIYIQSDKVNLITHIDMIRIENKDIKDINLSEDGILTINNLIAFNTKET